MNLKHTVTVFAVILCILSSMLSPTAQAQPIFLSTEWKRLPDNAWEKMVTGSGGYALLYIQKEAGGIFFSVLRPCSQEEESYEIFRWKTGESVGQAIMRCPNGAFTIPAAPWAPSFLPLPDDLMEKPQQEERRREDSRRRVLV